ncbi:hypothetical protein [Actinomadura rubrisoli]|uniref:Uncharacterized protein n=1 Tax=Actinomadura rubrisoli TaxID=2530368 RepID=A0A4R5CCK3_9ACTN|nr:hypothetical protein [Actinomadura rubrisoli]TDD97185.1 hypothetical protein E1298_01750 [Actinomadura rubrisoli]
MDEKAEQLAELLWEHLTAGDSIRTPLYWDGVASMLNAEIPRLEAACYETLWIETDTAGFGRFTLASVTLAAYQQLRHKVVKEISRQDHEGLREYLEEE